MLISPLESTDAPAEALLGFSIFQLFLFCVGDTERKTHTITQRVLCMHKRCMLECVLICKRKYNDLFLTSVKVSLKSLYFLKVKTVNVSMLKLCNCTWLPAGCHYRGKSNVSICIPQSSAKPLIRFVKRLKVNSPLLTDLQASLQKSQRHSLCSL